MDEISSPLARRAETRGLGCVGIRTKATEHGIGCWLLLRLLLLRLLLTKTSRGLAKCCPAKSKMGKINTRYNEERTSSLAKSTRLAKGRPTRLGLLLIAPV